MLFWWTVGGWEGMQKDKHDKHECLFLAFMGLENVSHWSSSFFIQGTCCSAIEAYFKINLFIFFFSNSLSLTLGKQNYLFPRLSQLSVLEHTPIMETN